MADDYIDLYRDDMRRNKRRHNNAIPRPTHPGRSIYTAILHNRFSVGEVAAVCGVTRNQLVKVLKGNQQLSPRLAFLLAEFFSWDLALRWLIMQTKCNMYEVAVRERKARKALMLDDPSEVGTPEWEETVRQAWDVADKEDPSENDSYPVLQQEEERRKVIMKEELDARRDEDGMAGTGTDVRTAAHSRSDEDELGGSSA
jgi:plasmid maintenance system antidote protein VapI